MLAGVALRLFGVKLTFVVSGYEHELAWIPSARVCMRACVHG
jgi:hypothetical protein